MAISVSLLGIGFNQIGIAQPGQSQNLTSTEKQHLLDGISFEIDNVTFTHHTATVNGIQMHYVMGGKGNPVVLLHGWPETWYEWRHVMPGLAKNYTVIAPDLRGLGDSSKPTTGYDGKTVAEDIHQLVGRLGFKTIFLVGHDIGTFTSLSLRSCTSFRSEGASSHGSPYSWLLSTCKASIMVGPIPSNTRRPRSPLYKEKRCLYLSWFYHNLANNPTAITQEDINEYVTHYSAPGGMRAGFEYYGSIPQDANTKYELFQRLPLQCQVLGLGGGYTPAFGGNVTMPSVVYGMKIFTQNVTGIVVPNSGHWIPEEQPQFLTDQLLKFFGNTK